MSDNLSNQGNYFNDINPISTQRRLNNTQNFQGNSSTVTHDERERFPKQIFVGQPAKFEFFCNSQNIRFLLVNRMGEEKEMELEIMKITKKTFTDPLGKPCQSIQAIFFIKRKEGVNSKKVPNKPFTTIYYDIPKHLTKEFSSNDAIVDVKRLNYQERGVVVIDEDTKFPIDQTPLFNIIETVTEITQKNKFPEKEDIMLLSDAEKVKYIKDFFSIMK